MPLGDLSIATPLDRRTLSLKTTSNTCDCAPPRPGNASYSFSKLGELPTPTRFIFAPNLQLTQKARGKPCGLVQRHAGPGAEPRAVRAQPTHTHAVVGRSTATSSSFQSLPAAARPNLMGRALAGAVLCRDWRRRGTRKTVLREFCTIRCTRVRSPHSNTAEICGRTPRLTGLALCRWETNRCWRGPGAGQLFRGFLSTPARARPAAKCDPSAARATV